MTLLIPKWKLAIPKTNPITTHSKEKTKVADVEIPNISVAYWRSLSDQGEKQLKWHNNPIQCCSSTPY